MLSKIVTLPITLRHRVEDLVPSLGNQASEVQFSSLRKAIKGVQEASTKLDAEKYEAEENFKKLLSRMRFPFPRRDGVRHRGQRTGALRRAADWVKGVFGVPPPTGAELQRLSIRSAESWEEYLEYTSIAALEIPLEGEADVEDDKYAFPHPIREFIKAAKRVGRANRKLKAFERGFISEGGIKDREWYRHLGVAPGKWLGTQPKLIFLRIFILPCLRMNRLWRDDTPWADGGHHF